jgi:hypothetical protein
MKTITITAVAASASICCSLVCAQPAADLLAGPSVAEAETATTLLRRGLDGRITPLTVPPAIAAIELLGLTDAARAKVDALLVTRTALMDELVLGNITLLTEIEPAFRAGSPADKLGVITRAMQALAPARAWGTIRDRVNEVLPAAKAERYEALIGEYERAAYLEAMASGRVDSAFAFRMERHWQDIGWEIEQAADRVLRDDGTDWMAKLIARLHLTPEQSQTIRKMGETFYIETKGRPSKAQEIAFIEAVAEQLTGTQRLKVIGMALRGELEDDAMME